MPELTQDSTSPPAVPPSIDPAEWESFPLFRESALLYISEPRFNAAVRVAGEMFYGMLLESYGDWPEWAESSTRTELRAAVADLRHLTGFLASIGLERKKSALSEADAKLSKFAADTARTLNQIANGIERKLAKEASS